MGKLAVLNPAASISEADATAIVERFGFTARSVNPGFFIATVERNRFGHRHIGDDVAYIGSHGDITPYADDAQAFLAATALRNAIQRFI